MSVWMSVMIVEHQYCCNYTSSNHKHDCIEICGWNKQNLLVQIIVNRCHWLTQVSGISRSKSKFTSLNSQKFETFQLCQAFLLKLSKKWHFVLSKLWQTWGLIVCKNIFQRQKYVSKREFDCDQGLESWRIFCQVKSIAIFA